MSVAAAPRLLPLARWGLAVLAGVVALIVLLPLLALVVLAGGWTDSARAAASPVDGAALDEWMADEVPGSPLVGMGHVFVAEGVRNGLDPRALVAIARHESVLGTAGSGAGIHNAFGWGPAIAFQSWQDNIATVARGLAYGYVARGRATLVEIQPVWAPVGAANDPSDLNSAWTEAVSRYYADLGGDPELPITLAAQGGALAGGPTVGASGLATPTGGVGSLGGGPGEGTHSYGSPPHNWQSDRAVDIGLPFGSPLYAIDGGVVVRVGGNPTDFAGRFGGARLTVVSADDAYYYAHLSGVVVGDGERVALGQLIGFSGSANGVEHLHLGVMRRDPVSVGGVG
ncbi:M23 family metallopeptidase [Miltoncostaea marina]|uniref:M23 family metallopeptidase n=1 Tax=Miltoncostaea marina TaxID=2843215 RepID=UPI001C3C9ADF|nr:M23 family metallopeptidase [Miltoncostaea marina]